MCLHPGLGQAQSEGLLSEERKTGRRPAQDQPVQFRDAGAGAVAERGERSQSGFASSLAPCSSLGLIGAAPVRTCWHRSVRGDLQKALDPIEAAAMEDPPLSSWCQPAHSVAQNRTPAQPVAIAREHESSHSEGRPCTPMTGTTVGPQIVLLGSGCWSLWLLRAQCAP